MSSDERHTVYMEILDFMKQKPEALLTRTLPVATSIAADAGIEVPRLNPSAMERAVVIVREMQFDVRDLMIGGFFHSAVLTVKDALRDLNQLRQDCNLTYSVETDSMNQIATIVLANLAVLEEDSAK